MPRYVILEHDHPTLHWDFMLEHQGVLKTWRLDTKPEGAGQTIAATALGDHRQAYLDYEGPVSGARGHVKRWDCGTYEIVAGDLEKSHLRVELKGARSSGSVELVQQAGDRWQATIHGLKEA